MTYLGILLGLVVALALVCWGSATALALAALACLRVLRWFGVDERLVDGDGDGE